MVFDTTTPIVASMLVQQNEALVASLLALDAPLSLVRSIQQVALEGLALRHVPEALRLAAQTAFAQRVLAVCATVTVYRQQFTVPAADPNDAPLRAQLLRELAHRVLVIPVLHTWLAAQEPFTLVGQCVAWPRHTPFADLLYRFTGAWWQIRETTACLRDDPTIVVVLPRWARVFLADLGQWCHQQHLLTIAAGEALAVLADSQQARGTAKTFTAISSMRI